MISANIVGVNILNILNILRWEQLCASRIFPRHPHSPEVAGSNPPPLGIAMPVVLALAVRIKMKRHGVVSPGPVLALPLDRIPGSWRK